MRVCFGRPSVMSRHRRSHINQGLHLLHVVDPTDAGTDGTRVNLNEISKNKTPDCGLPMPLRMLILVGGPDDR